jgi:hypothetical protein
MNQFPQVEFFRKFAEIFAVQRAPPVSLIPAANLPPVSFDTGGKFATAVNNTSGIGGKI